MRMAAGIFATRYLACSSAGRLSGERMWKMSFTAAKSRRTNAVSIACRRRFSILLRIVSECWCREGRVASAYSSTLKSATLAYVVEQHDHEDRQRTARRVVVYLAEL